MHYLPFSRRGYFSICSKPNVRMKLKPIDFVVNAYKCLQTQLSGIVCVLRGRTEEAEADIVKVIACTSFPLPNPMQFKDRVRWCAPCSRLISTPLPQRKLRNFMRKSISAYYSGQNDWFRRMFLILLGEPVKAIVPSPFG